MIFFDINLVTSFLYVIENFKEKKELVIEER